MPIATASRAGEGTVTRVVSEMRTASVREIDLTAEVKWGDGRGGSIEASFSGLSHDDQVEAGLRVGLLGEGVPKQVSHDFESMIETSDPLAPLADLMLTPAAEEAVGALLISERLLRPGKASHIDRFALGPPHLGQRQIELVYTEPGNHEPGTRRIEGVRRAQ